MMGHSEDDSWMLSALPAALSFMVLLAASAGATFTGSGSVILTSGTRTISDSTITASAQNESGVFVTGGVLTLKNDAVTSAGYVSTSSASKPGSGSASSTDSASFYGLAAGILAWTESGSAQIDITNTRVRTTGAGANGVFAYGKGVISIYGDSVICTGNYAHAIMCAGGGTITASHLYMNTAGTNSGAVATDRNGGIITVDSSTVITTGSDSPGIYSTGSITVSNSSVTSAVEAASIEGTNSITLNRTALSGAAGKKHRGVFIYQSMSGDATGSHSTFTMNGGSYAWTSSDGPAFFVTNDTGVIKLTGVTVNNSSPMLALSSSISYYTSESWGTAGSNGGKMRFTADSGTVLTGNVVADSISDVFFTLANGSSLKGAIDSADAGALVTLNLDAASSWSVTATSYLDTLTDPAIDVSSLSVSNITGNGYNVIYRKAANTALGGKVYSLNGSGCLVPEDSASATCGSSAGISAVTSSVVGSSVRFNAGWGRISLAAGGTKKLALYNLQGRLLGIRSTTDDAVSIPELFGVPAGNLYVLKVLSAL